MWELKFNQRHKPPHNMTSIFLTILNSSGEDIRFYWGIGHYTFGKVLVISTVKGKT